MAAAAGFTGQLLVQAHGQLAAVERAQPELAVVEGVALRQLGDVVDRAAHRARAEQEGGGAADGLDAVIDPAVHRAPGHGVVLHRDAVEQLRDLAAGEPPVADRAGVAGGRCVVHARDAARDLLRIQRPARVDLLA
ncbi:hypothetical protein D3C71_1721640 [compost metagenome]